MNFYTGPANEEDITVAELAESLSAFVKYVWEERRKVLRPIGIAVAVGLFVAFGSGDEYTATARLLPYRSGTSGISGLAGLAGLRLPTGGSDQTITADLYPEVASSQDFRISIAETQLTFSSLSTRATSIEYFRNLRRIPLTERTKYYTIDLPSRLLSYSRSRKPASLPDSSRFADGSQKLQSYDQEYLELVNTLKKRLTVSIDKKTSIITITAEMPDPYAAADLVRVTSDQLMKKIIEHESGKAREQYRFASEQYQLAKTRYERSQRDLASFSDRNRALMSASSQIDRDRLQREYDLAFEVYQQFSREREQARIKMNQDTPVFTVLENATVPALRSSPKRTRILVIATLLGALIGVSQITLHRLKAGTLRVQPAKNGNGIQQTV